MHSRLEIGSGKMYGWFVFESAVAFQLHLGAELQTFWNWSISRSQTESMDGALWQEFRELIAFDRQEDFVDDEVLWDRMPELESFKNKGVLIKPARWFSWNQCCSGYLVEFHSLKMLLKHKFKGDILPNDVVEETQLIGMGKRVGVESKKASEQDEDILRGLARMRKASDPRKELQDLKRPWVDLNWHTS